MRHFVRQSIKGGRCSALNQYFKSTFSDQVFNIMSQKLGVDCNICEILDKYLEYKNKHRKLLEDDYDSQYKDYRDIDQEERMIMNKVYVETFNKQTFNKDGDESTILRIKYYNPPNFIFQHLPVKEKVLKKEVKG